MKFLSFLCTKWMENCEVMTSSTHSFAYSYRLVKKCFLKICETAKCHNFLIFQPIFIRFSLFCSNVFTLSSEIKLNLLWISSLKTTSENTCMAPAIKILNMTYSSINFHFLCKMLLKFIDERLLHFILVWLGVLSNRVNKTLSEWIVNSFVQIMF